MDFLHLKSSTGRASKAALVMALVCTMFINSSAQDNGQEDAKLKSLVNGTLQNAQRFRDASTRVTSASTLGQLTATPPATAPANASLAQTGILQLGLSRSGRDGYVFVPPACDSADGCRMILAIHAAGKGGLDAIGVLVDQANSSGILLLAPDSRGATWDALPAQGGQFGPDVAFINAALSQVFALYRINASSLGIQGFSDGATYALGLGMTNGKLFQSVMANTPGGIIAQVVQGQPPIFVSAGLNDTIFPINQGGNPDVCYLISLGYTVTYIQFNGGHEVLPDIANKTVQWYLGQLPGAGTIPTGVCKG